MQYIDYCGSKVSVMTPTVSDFERIREICEDRFGEGYITKEEFSRWVADADYCKIAVIDGNIVGIVYLMPEQIAEVAKALKLDERYINTVSGGKKVIHSRCAALDKAYERRGIMYFLHKEVFDNIRANGFGAVFAPAWIYNGFTPMAHLLDKFDFEFVGERENLWLNMKGYKCIICGGPCHCKAAIYQKKY